MLLVGETLGVESSVNHNLKKRKIQKCKEDTFMDVSFISDVYTDRLVHNVICHSEVSTYAAQILELRNLLRGMIHIAGSRWRG